MQSLGASDGETLQTFPQERGEVGFVEVVAGIVCRGGVTAGEFVFKVGAFGGYCLDFLLGYIVSWYESRV